MRNSRSLSIHLPTDIAEMIEAKAASGAYADESAVILAGLMALADRDAGLERWLLEDVVPVYEEMKAHPERAIPIAQASDALHVHIDTLVAKHRP